jgi:hypothetical protein
MARIISRHKATKPLAYVLLQRLVVILNVSCKNFIVQAWEFFKKHVHIYFTQQKYGNIIFTEDYSPLV